MERYDTPGVGGTPAAGSKRKGTDNIPHTAATMPLSADAASQRMRILDYLRAHGRMTTTDTRTLLDVMHPAARVQELREKGYDIVTHWETVDTGKGLHRVGCYALLTDGRPT